MSGPDDAIEAGFKEGTEESPPQVATLEQIRRLALERRQKPAQHFTCAETNMKYTFRPLTGAELDKITSWAAGDSDKYEQLVVEHASVDPKVNLPFWAELKTLGPLATTGLVLFVNEISGMGEEAIKKAKNASKGVVA